MRTIKVAELDSNLLKVYFDVRLLSDDPALAEAGGQPQLSLNGATFDNTGIGTLIAVGFGNYYAMLSTSILTTPGDVIKTRYKSGITKETVGDAFLVTSSDSTLPDDAITVSYYGSLASADAYFSNSLTGRAWKKSSPNNKQLALTDATQMIDRLNFAGDKVSEGQVLQFPRGNTYIDPKAINSSETADVNIPEDIKTATYIIADRLLDGVDPDIESDLLAVSSSKYSSVGSNYNREFIPEHLVAGIPSAKAWSLLRPYIRDERTISVTRA